MNRLLMSLALSCSAFMLQTAHAEQAPVPLAGDFFIQLADVDRNALLERVTTLRSQLIQRKQALLQIIADNTLDSSDTFLSVILPGGLLYAGYKKASSEQAKNELANINADIEEFSADLVALQPGSPAVAIAQLQPAR
ncbi:MAG: hypothetical protein OEV12_11295 [Gammaproteobacteria bacterium]|nr:hypothetical protein [Gammaproteobacteria bacterium]